MLRFILHGIRLVSRAKDLRHLLIRTDKWAAPLLLDSCVRRHHYVLELPAADDERWGQFICAACPCDAFSLIIAFLNFRDNVLNAPILMVLFSPLAFQERGRGRSVPESYLRVKLLWSVLELGRRKVLRVLRWIMLRHSSGNYFICRLFLVRQLQEFTVRWASVSNYILLVFHSLRFDVSFPFIFIDFNMALV